MMKGNFTKAYSWACLGDFTKVQLMAFFPSSSYGFAHDRAGVQGALVKHPWGGIFFFRFLFLCTNPSTSPLRVRA